MNIDSQSRMNQVQTSLRNKANQSSQENGELGKKEFMNLFMTQMSNQNPMDPMDSGAMMSQLAELGTMEQLENLNGGMKSLNATQSEIARHQAMDFIGKNVLVDAKNISLSRGSGQPLYYDLNKDTTNLRVQIEDLDGTPIRSEELGYMTAGKHQFSWDGMDNAGTMMPDGHYKIRLLASYTDGTSAALNGYESGRVSQVEYRDGKPWIKMRNRLMPLDKVQSVDNSSQRIFGNAKPLPLIHELSPQKMMEAKKESEVKN